jgi:hypothetical protein
MFLIRNQGLSNQHFFFRGSLSSIRGFHNYWFILAHLTGGQGVAGSNPVAPTVDNQIIPYKNRDIA